MYIGVSENVCLDDGEMFGWKDSAETCLGRCYCIYTKSQDSKKALGVLWLRILVTTESIMCAIYQVENIVMFVSCAVTEECAAFGEALSAHHLPKLLMAFQLWSIRKITAEQKGAAAFSLPSSQGALGLLLFAECALWVGCTNCPAGNPSSSRRCWGVPVSMTATGFVQCHPALLFPFSNRLRLEHCLMHLISFWFRMPAPEVCTELVSSLTSFSCLGHLKMENLICSDSFSLSDFPPWVEMLMPLDSPHLSADAAVGLGDAPIQGFWLFLPFQYFLLLFPVSLEGS